MTKTMCRIPDQFIGLCSTNVMVGRKIIYIDANAENNFLPMPDKNVMPI
ncbi:MAG: hypothetical protein ACLSFZ_14155 [Frisingicoccus sp.]